MNPPLTFVFVHGLSGWGSYDKQYQRMPYWGMRGGDLITWLRAQGFDCYAASVSPTGSAWDRACELYAQLTGTRTDYGEAHSREYRHERYGKDFFDCPLIPSWNEDTKLVLLGHSFGGATVRLFSEIMAHGDPAEQETENPSPYFQGGQGDRIHTIVTLASPMNGTTAYDMFADPDFDPNQVDVPWWSKSLAEMMSKGTKPNLDARDERDYANYDMHIDRARELNQRMKTQPHIYYFSLPCSATAGTAVASTEAAETAASNPAASSATAPPAGFESSPHKPVPGMEPLFVMRSTQIGAYTGKTAGGILIDDTWRENDGLVNTISAMAPEGAPSKPFDRKHIEPGIWNVLPTVKGDHMWPQGGLMHKHEIRPFYEKLLKMIETL